ncbi:transmembrane channel-like protein 3 [Pogonomyrmex barbatus]|uniref:Transmembrane channel-like protein 3 n=1 Tax=Pogonomyrmex barbatus TaxID=144034 RepID=A0A8N1S9X1_9HYME|nr:transmembrane channel-like protein 3 [Pogonomyrmex barbatus]
MSPSFPSHSQPSISRRSIIFGTAECQQNENLDEEDQRSQSERTNERTNARHMSNIVASERASPNGSSQNPTPILKSIADNDETEDDYSESAYAIMRQQNSRQNRRRRCTTMFGVDNVDGIARPQSSICTMSWEDTITSTEGSGNQEQIFENLTLHQEVLSGAKQQPWPLRRKIKLVRQAKAYVRRHEGALQERLAQSHSTKDIVTRISFFITKKLQYFRRELIDLQIWLIPWEYRIMEIESHFGSAVASYFIFLRWLFWINFVIVATLTMFIVIPGVLIANATPAGERKLIREEKDLESMDFSTLLNFDGVLKHSPLFYGWYTNQDSDSNYKLPLAYFVTNLVVYTYSFAAILRKMVENSRLNKLTEKEDEYVFSWKLFTGWDFMIGNPETAYNRSASIALTFKEDLLEEAEKQKDKRNWRIISIRIFVHTVVLLLFVLSVYAVLEVVKRSRLTTTESDGWWRQNEITIVMSLIMYMFPIFFECLGFLENYHPRKQLQLQLMRIMLLNLLNLYTLIFALTRKINSMKHKLQDFKKRQTICIRTLIDCRFKLTPTQLITILSLTSFLIHNVTFPYDERETSELDYDNYQYITSDASGNNALSVTSYYKEQNWCTKSVDDSEVRYDRSSIDNFLSDSTAAKHFYTGSNLFQKNSVERTVEMIESNTMHTDRSSPCLNKSVIFFLDKDGRKNDAKKCYEKLCFILKPEDLRINDFVKSLFTLSHFFNFDELNQAICNLRQLCWETTFGQELIKLIVMDLILAILNTFIADFLRAVFVRFMNKHCCWDLEKQFPQYGDFNIADNILHLVNNQGIVWMGMFFSPGLMALNLIKLGVLMYLRSWAVLTCNVPHKVIFRISRSNNFYFLLLLIMLSLCVLPVSYFIVYIEPSRYCGSFSNYPKIYNVVTQYLQNTFPTLIQRCLDFVVSPCVLIQLIIVMTLIIYYETSVAGSLREENNDLKMQRRQHIEEHRKLFKIREMKENNPDTALLRWKQILLTLPRASMTQNSEITENSSDDIQITIGESLEDTMDNKMNDTKEDQMLSDQTLSNFNNEKLSKMQYHLT